jgi:dTDP-4-amino-4,6-dideoxygalactose transaminase
MIHIAKPYICDEEKKAVIEVLNSGIIAQGPKVKEFENKFADFCGTKYAVALNNGTAGLHTGLHVMGIGKGDEVITTPLTFIATANTILMQNAKQRIDNLI